MNTKNILYFILACASGLAVASCDKGYTYEPAAAESSDQVVVYMDKSMVGNLDVDGSDIVVPFMRNTKNGEQTVSISFSDKSGLFTPTSKTVYFADGSDTAEYLISYDYSKLKMGASYTLDIRIDDQTVISPYAISERSLTCIKAWQNLGKAQFYDDWFIEAVCEKTLLQSPDGSMTYRIVEPFTREEVEAATLDYTGGLPYLEFSVDEEGNITYQDYFNLPFFYKGRTCHFAGPMYLKKDAGSQAKNGMIDPQVAQFVWYPLLNFDGNGYSWWGKTSSAWLSFPGGPDLAEFLGL